MKAILIALTVAMAATPAMAKNWKAEFIACAKQGLAKNDSAYLVDTCEMGVMRAWSQTASFDHEFAEVERAPWFKAYKAAVIAERGYW